MNRTASEIESTREDFPWGSIIWLASQNVGNTKGVTMGRMSMSPGGENGMHHHPDCEECIYVLSGDIEHTVDGRAIRQSAGDFLAVPVGVQHGTKNIGNSQAELMIAFSSGNREFVPA